MRLFDSRRRAPVQADVGPGFWLIEPLAVQRTIEGAMTMSERRRAEASAQLLFAPGAEGRVVVHWRSRIIGFVPAAHAGRLLAQLVDAPKKQATGSGLVVRHEDLWRVWAGPEPAAQPPPPAELGELAPETPKVLGIPIGTRGGGRAAARAKRSTTRVLTVGTHSWDVREGDVDLELLRRRLATAEPGVTLHVRIRDETVEVQLSPGQRVTLSDGTPETTEVLYPAD